MRRTDRAERLLDLLSLLLTARRALSWAEIRDAFPGDYAVGNEASALRKFERDKAALVELGVPIEWIPPGEGTEGGYRVDAGRYYLDSVPLRPEERSLLLVAGVALAEQPGFPLREELLHALDKLLFSASEQDALSAESVRRALRLPSVRDQGEGDETLAGLGRAIAARKALRIVYTSFDGVRTERDIWPYGLAFRRGSWLLVAHCHLRDGIRSFAVGRIEALEPAGRGSGPDFEIPEAFDLQAHVGREAWELGVHEPREVRLRVREEAAPLARNLFGKSEPEEEPGGDLVFTLRITNEQALLRLVLQLGPHAEVVEPENLRRQVRELAEKIAGEEAEGDAPRGGAEASLGEGARGGEVRESHGAGPMAGARPRKPTVEERLRRALVLIPYAVAHPGCTVEELAQVARLSPGELLQELDFLRMIGKPPFSPADLIDIDVVDGRVEVVLPQGLHRPPAFTLLEAMALDAAISALAAEGEDALSSLRGRLRAMLPEKLRQDFDGIAGRVQVETEGIDPRTAETVDRGITEGREIELTYFTAGRGVATRRVLRPLARVLHQGYWYLHAFCVQRRERRLFRLDRASDVVLTERRFLRRGSGGAPAALSPAETYAWLRVGTGPGRDPEYLRRLGAAEVQEEGDGSLLVAFPLHGEAYLCSLALSFAGAARFVEPPALQDRLRTLARQVADRHASLSRFPTKVGG